MPDGPAFSRKEKNRILDFSRQAVFRIWIRIGSALDPHSIGFLDPDSGGVKSAKLSEKKKPNDRKSKKVTLMYETVTFV
jgi:hypothetical protein